jgi:hypothetical protein
VEGQAGAEDEVEVVVQEVLRRARGMLSRVKRRLWQESTVRPLDKAHSHISRLDR